MTMSEADAGHDELAAAYDQQDWEQVLRFAPEHPEGTAALRVGHAHWHLGEVGAAVRWLEIGLADPGPSIEDLTPFRYAVGMGCFLRADPLAARRHLRVALGAAADSPWWFPVLRGLAQVEMELGLLDAADARLRLLPEDSSGRALQHVMRAKAAWRAGKMELSRVNLWIALHEPMARPEDSEDPYHLIDQASLLVTGAEILAAMGHGAECHRVLDAASARLEAAGSEGLPIETHLRLYRAMAYRLTGDRSAASELLDGVAHAAVAAEAQDLLAAVTRERARLSWDAGGVAEARATWALAARRFDALGYVWEAEATRQEAIRGPVGDVDAQPIERWFEEDADIHEDPPVGTVVSVTLPNGDDEALERMLSLAEALADRVAANTVGYIDGWGTDGDEFEVFAYGDDPERLWEAMEEPIQALGHPVTVGLEWGNRFGLRLLHSPTDLAGLQSIRPRIPPLSQRDADDAPLSRSALVSRLAAMPLGTDRPLHDELELLRTARLDRERIWLWRWGREPEHRYVTVMADPPGPLIVRADPTDGLTPEQHLVSLRFGYRSTLPAHLW
jgi:hypothetical protein